MMVKSLNKGTLEVGVAIVCDNKEISHEEILDAFAPLVPNIAHTEKEKDNETDMTIRRQRICDVFTQGQELIDLSHDFVLILEDDTIVESDALIKLIQNWDFLEQVWDTIPFKGPGIISGVQTGRWGNRIIGAWHVDNPKDPHTVYSASPDGSGMESVTATGFYCCLTTPELFCSATFRHDFLGPDFFFGLDVAAKGYRNYITWDVPCIHKTRTITLHPSDANSVTTFINEGDYWATSVDYPSL